MRFSGPEGPGGLGSHSDWHGIPRPSIGVNLTFLLVKQPNGTAVVRAEGVFICSF